MARRRTARSYCRTSSSNAEVFPCWASRMRAESSTRCWVTATAVRFAGTKATGLVGIGRRRILLVSDTFIFPVQFRLSNKFVAGAVYGQDEARFIRFRLELLTQAHDMRVHGARRGEPVVSPHVFE